MTRPIVLDGAAPLLLIADHASNDVPPGIDLGIDPALLDTHIALDIGTAALTEALAVRLGAPAILATVCRLAIDLNRDPAVADVIPAASDGHIIPGNLLLSPTERDMRVVAIHTAYHAAVAAEIATRRPALLVSVHSFTPARSAHPGESRPWPVAVLYNLDERAARIALALLRTAGHNAGDNQPYSGRELNYTMDRHAEMAGIPYLGIEVRQDEIGDAAGVAKWAAIISELVAVVAAALPFRS